MLSKGHIQAVTDYEEELPDYTWMISTIRTKRQCKLASWFQCLEDQSAEGQTKSKEKILIQPPDHFVLKEPQNLLEQTTGNVKEAQLSHYCPPANPGEISYRNGNITIVIDSEDITFTLEVDRETIDQVSGYFIVEEVRVFLPPLPLQCFIMLPVMTCARSILIFMLTLMNVTTRNVLL